MLFISLTVEKADSISITELIFYGMQCVVLRSTDSPQISQESDSLKITPRLCLFSGIIYRGIGSPNDNQH